MKNNAKELQTNGNVATNNIKAKPLLTGEQLKSEQLSNKIIDEIVEKLGFAKLPPEIAISTMTLACKINTKFNCRNIARYVDLTYGGILSVKCGNEDNTKTNRTLLPKKQKTGKKKKKRRVFYNQVSIYVMVKGKNKKPVSVKLFLNGAIQMTGCKTVAHAIEALNKIFNELSKIKAIIASKNYCLKVVEKKFATSIEILNIKNVKDIRIAMINSNFRINFKIDRAKLHNLMLAENYEVSYDPEKHACVNIKYDHMDKQLSIFVFEGGSIIITGVNNCFQIVDAYNFINKYLLMNYNKIVKNDNLTNSNIIKFLDKANMIENINDNLSVSSDSDNDINTKSDDDFNYNSDDEINDIDDLIFNSEDIELTEAAKYMSDIYKFTNSDDDEKPTKISKTKTIKKQSKANIETHHDEKPTKANKKNLRKN